MKNKKLTAIVTMTFMLFGLSMAIAQPDFRNTKWGMNISSVKKTETCKLITEESRRLSYECALADIDGTLIYTFTSFDKLMRAKYLLTPKYINVNFFLRDYKMFQELLTQKYGEAVSKSAVTINKQSATENEWAANLSAGNLRLESKWAKGITEIKLTLSRIGDKPAIQIDYISKEASDTDMKERKEKIIKVL